jgi:hypothetical protein
MRFFIKTDSTGKIIKNNFGRFVTKCLNPFNMEQYEEISEEESKLLDDLDGKIPYLDMNKIVLKETCDRYMKNTETGEITVCCMVEDEPCCDGFKEVTKEDYSAWEVAMKKTNLEAIVRQAGDNLIAKDTQKRNELIEKIAITESEDLQNPFRQELVAIITSHQAINAKVAEHIKAIKAKKTTASLQNYQDDNMANLEEDLNG